MSRYQDLADRTAALIQAGVLRPGDRLPPQRDLAQQVGVDLTTVTRAFAELRQAGLLDAQGAGGTFIALSAGNRSTSVDLSMNIPPLLGSAPFAQGMEAGLQHVGQQLGQGELMSYHVGAGTREDRAAAVQWLAPMLGTVGADQVVICPGAQTALCALILARTQPGELITTASGVKIIGYTDLPGRLPTQSSQLYATNLVNLTKLLSKEKDGNIDINFEDVVLRNMSVVRDGEVTFPPPAISVSAAPKKEAAAAPVAKEAKQPSKLKYWLAAAGLAGFGWVGHVAPPEFLAHFTVFVLACVVGYYVVWNVTHSLHTPLMSVTNAISGIIVVGALLQIGAGSGLIATLAFVAVLIATINIVGGFTVTHRMLKMFRKD